MSKVYSYTETTKGIYRPYLKVYFLHPESSYNFEIDGLLDSGSIFSIFPSWFLSLLEHNLKKGRKPIKVNIANKEVKGYLHTVKVKIDKFDKVFDWEIYFSDDIDDWGFGILGHYPFFSHFKVTFDYPEKIFLLSKL